MKSLLAFLCFAGAAYFVYIAVSDNYAPARVVKKHGNVFGNSTSVIKWRFLIAGLLAWAGVALL